MATRVSFNGAFFDHRGEHDLDEYGRAVLDTLSRQGYAIVMTNLNRSIKHPTPYYETQVRIEDRPPWAKSINDRGIIYGPWLEGTSPRNITTRFKGYASFRRAGQQLEREKVGLIRWETERVVARLNGR